MGNRTAIDDTPMSAVKAHDGGAALVLELQRLIDRSGSCAEGRQRDRFPIHFRLEVTPIDRLGNFLDEDTICVFGKNLSLAGISFSHDNPLTYRRVRVSLIDPNVGKLDVAADVIWTRPTPIGLYESGCRLIRKLAGHGIRASR